MQIAFMKQLAAEGLEHSTDVVFLDMDALVVDSIAEVSSPSSARCVAFMASSQHP